MQAKTFAVALAGNPNVGKSTLFNALTGLRQHTGNWAGKTVENARGQYRFQGKAYELTDVPGAYSLSTRSLEEEEALSRLVSERADAVIVVCDATSLLRSLHFALQVCEMSERIILCVNLIDEAEKNGLQLDLALLEKRIGVPVVGVSARNKRGLHALKCAVEQVCMERIAPCPPSIPYPAALMESVERIAPLVCRGDDENHKLAYWRALRLLAQEKSFLDTAGLSGVLQRERDRLFDLGYTKTRLQSDITHAVYACAEKLLDGVIVSTDKHAACKQTRIDRILTRRLVGIPIMLLLLFVVFFVTIAGANVLSDRLMGLFTLLGDWMRRALTALRMPPFLLGLLLDGVYRTLTWVAAVMLPPMAIFFPLFTLLEDLGYLPRAAFNLDASFRRCGGCGRQALTMCMGLGCNVAGVACCRIIDSPRERLVAILTNVFVPCNGRFPTLITMITLFLVAGRGGVTAGLSGALLLTLTVLVGVGMTFACSKLLSATLLSGAPSVFTLELPPFRKPQIGRVIVRSVFERTLFVLSRAVCVAAPAGLLIYLLANVSLGGATPLAYLIRALEPIGRLLGMDGTILTAFVLGLPANEIVLPLAAMSYSSAGALMDVSNLSAFGDMLRLNGWTIKTAICCMLFMLFHWPCAATIQAIRRETGSMKWTLVSIALPSAVGTACCLMVNAAFALFGGG